MKKIVSLIIAFAVLCTLSVPVYAGETPSQKEEDVYGILNSDGSVNSLYVVNIFSSGSITDYGSYSEIRNLVTSDQLNQTGDRITVNTTADKLYYQGMLESKELPWNIAIQYLLDGNEISAESLGGNSGALQVTVSVTQNPHVNSTFYNNYALQITLPLDTKLCDNIQAENATVADAGSKKQLSYTVLPGQGADISVTANVHDFEMDAITISGIKLSLNITIDKDLFSEQITQLTDAIKALDNGSGELLDGADQLSDGMEEYIDGLKTFQDGLSELAGGVDGLNTGVVSLKEGLSELSKQNETLINGALAMQQATFDTVNSQLSAMNLELPVLTPENYSSVLENIPALAAVKTQLDGVVQFTEGLKSYTGGVSQLSEGASALADGTSQLNSSTSAMAAAMNALYHAGSELNSAIKKLRDGLASYKDGTSEFRSQTSDLDSEISDRIDKIVKNMTGNGDEVMSFVSDKNTNITAVQFALKTEAIESHNTETSGAEENVLLNFWQKLLKLFGL